MTRTESPTTLFSVVPYRAVELIESDIRALQRFFDANPEYFETVNGQPPREDEARQEFVEMPPAGMGFTKKWMLGFVHEQHGLIGMATILSDFLAPRVWHIGLYIVASSLHGSGVGRSIYEALEDWMKNEGALWVRLGVVVGNRKAEGFWERLGYSEVRRRTDVETGRKRSEIRVMVKRLDRKPLGDYLDLVARDRPGAP